MDVGYSDPGAFLRGNHGAAAHPATGTAVFEDGSGTAQITLQTQDDARDVADNDLTVFIIRRNHYETGTPGYASVNVADNDVAAELELGLSERSVVEGQALTVTVWRHGVLGNEVQVPLSYGFQGQPETSLVTVLGEYDVQRSIELRPPDNDLSEGDRVYEVRIAPISTYSSIPDTAETEYWTVRGNRSQSATVTDDDLPMISVEAVRESYQEGEFGQVRLRRMGDTGSTLWFSVRIVQTPGASNSATGIVANKFNPGVSESTYNFSLISGDGDEPDGYISMVILPGDGYRIDPDASIAVFEVLDTDPTPTLAIEEARVSEGDGIINFKVSYGGYPSTKTITLDYTTRDGTATGGSDYTEASGTFVFGRKTQSGVISVPVLDDSIGEVEETFTLTLSNLSNALLPDGETSITVTGTIEDDEPVVSIAAEEEEVFEGRPAIFHLTRAGDDTGPLTVPLLVVSTGAEAATREEHVTFLAGEDTAEWSLPTQDDQEVKGSFVVTAAIPLPEASDPPPAFTVGQRSAAVDVIDDDLPELTIEAVHGDRTEGEDAEFILTRSGLITDSLSVNVNITGGEAFTAGERPTMVAIPAGQHRSRLTLTTVNDAAQDGFDAIDVEILPGDGYSVGHPGSARTVMFDTNHISPVITVAAGNAWVTEGEDVVFSFARSNTSIEESLTIRVILETLANKGTDFGSLTYDRENVEVTFEADTATATLVHPTVDENLNDGNNSVKAQINLGNYAIRPYPGIATVWVRDDDIPTVTIEPEMGEYIEYSDAPLVVTLSRTGDTSIVLPIVRLLRNTYRWAEPRGIEIDDDDGEIFAGTAFSPGEESVTPSFGSRLVPTLGGQLYYEVLPHFCGQTVQGDCGHLPQYHVGEPHTSTIEIYNSLQGVRVEADQESVTEGGTATFTLHRYGGTPYHGKVPLNVRLEVTQNGEFISGAAPVTVQFPANVTTASVSVATTDDMLNEADGAITLTILDPADPLADEDVYETPRSQDFSYWSDAATVQVIDNDPGTMSIADAVADEDEGSIQFIVSVPDNPQGVSVDWTTVADDGEEAATPDADFTAAGGTLTLAPYETSGTISIVLLDDDIDEPDETFTVELGNAAGAVLEDSSATGTIDDDDPQQAVTIEPVSGAVEEGEDAVFEVHRYSLIGGVLDDYTERGPLTVNLRITQEGDFISGTAPTTVVFGRGEFIKRVAVPTDDDDLFEPSGSVTAAIGDSPGYFAGIADATVPVNDNDSTPIAIDDAGADEDASEMTFTVRLGTPAITPVTVDFATEDGTATSHDRQTGTKVNLGKDFEATSGTLTFAAGEDTQTITVALVDDKYDEDRETFTVKLSNPSPSGSLEDAVGEGTINDDDQRMRVVKLVNYKNRHNEDSNEPVRLTLELIAPGDTEGSEREIVVDWEVMPVTAQLADFMAVLGSVTIRGFVGNIEFDLVNDDLFEEKNETFRVELTGAKNVEIAEDIVYREMRIRDDESLSARVAVDTAIVSEGQDATFTVTLSGGVTTAPVDLTYTASGTATGGTDYTAPAGTLTIPAGVQTASIAITVLPDAVVDPGETLVVELSEGTSLQRDVKTPGNAVAFILDGTTITASVSDASATEGGPVQFTVTLSETPGAPVEVTWQTRAPTSGRSAGAPATANADYTPSEGTVTIPAGTKSGTFSVPTIQDAISESEEHFNVVLTGAHQQTGEGASTRLPLTVFSADGTIIDDDAAPGAMTLSVTPTEVGEDAGQTELTVTATLTGATTFASDTVVTVMLADDTAIAVIAEPEPPGEGEPAPESPAPGDEDYEPAMATLTILAGRSAGTGTLLLTPLDDSIAEAEETVKITGNAGALTVTPTSVTITDNDDKPTGATLGVAPSEVGEGDGETELVVYQH